MLTAEDKAAIREVVIEELADFSAELSDCLKAPLEGIRKAILMLDVSQLKATATAADIAVALGKMHAMLRGDIEDGDWWKHGGADPDADPVEPEA